MFLCEFQRRRLKQRRRWKNEIFKVRTRKILNIFTRHGAIIRSFVCFDVKFDTFWRVVVWIANNHVEARDRILQCETGISLWNETNRWENVFVIFVCFYGKKNNDIHGGFFFVKSKLTLLADSRTSQDLKWTEAWLKEEKKNAWIRFSNIWKFNIFWRLLKMKNVFEKKKLIGGGFGICFFTQNKSIWISKENEMQLAFTKTKCEELQFKFTKLFFVSYSNISWLLHTNRPTLLIF